MSPRIVEVRNHTRREVVAGLTSLSQALLQSAHARRCPAAFLHWDLTLDRIEYVEISSVLDPMEAQSLLKSHVSARKLVGWKLTSALLTE
jgi:hypothetical protein